MIPRVREISRLESADERLHRGLARFNSLRLAPRGPDEVWRLALREEVLWRERENAFVERERAGIQASSVRELCSPSEFEAWFRQLEVDGPGQRDELFPWLAEEATLAEMRWFLTQEAAGEAGFDDLVALTQLKLPQRAKLELARNYWDEMGRGRPAAMHGEMLGRLVRNLALPVFVHTTVWPALALGNLLLALAANRHYAFHSIGALGAVELTAPGRVSQVSRGLKRLGFSRENRMYFDVHATVDVKHSEAWISEVLLPLVKESPEAMPWIAEGALMRLQGGARCFARYREELFRTADSGR